MGGEGGENKRIFTQKCSQEYGWINRGREMGGRTQFFVARPPHGPIESRQDAQKSRQSFGFKQERQTDRQTDRQIDKLSIFWALLVFKKIRFGIPGQIDAYIRTYVHTYLPAYIHAYTGRWMDRLTDGWMDRQKEEIQIGGIEGK